MTTENLNEFRRLMDEAESNADSEHARFMLWMDEHRYEIREDLESAPRLREALAAMVRHTPAIVSPAVKQARDHAKTLLA